MTSEKGLKVGNKIEEGFSKAGQKRLSTAGRRRRERSQDFILVGMLG